MTSVADTGSSKTIALVSMPGGGKSTIGRQLAKRLGRRFLDSDSVIEHRLGCSIRKFFESEGEQRFRDMESEVLEDLTIGEPIVLATGGGAVLREANRQLLRDRCHVVYLQSTPEELYRRLRNDTVRPLLQVADPQAKLRILFSERDPLYRATAHFIIETGKPSITALVNLVVMRLELAGLLKPHTDPPTS